MGNKLSGEQHKQLEDAFAKYDINSDGFVSPRELQVGLGMEDIRDDVLDSIVAKADKNHDGKLDMKEWKEFVGQRFMKAFGQYDKDGSGTITTEEVRAAYKKHKRAISEEEIGGILSKIDPNGDGQITLVEFIEGLFLAFAL